MEYVAYPPDPNAPDPVGKIIAINDDDDNGNGVPDYLDLGPDAAEGDLVEVKLTAHTPIETYGQNMKLDWGGLRVWDSPTKDNLYDVTGHFKTDQGWPLQN